MALVMLLSDDWILESRPPCSFIFLAKKSPLVPLCQRENLHNEVDFPLFEKEGPGEIWDQSDENK
jgi:hypothetical protein